MVGEVEMNDSELRKAHIFTANTREVNPMVKRLAKFSDWSRVVRAVARLKRFVREFKGVQKRTNEASTLEERKEAEIIIIKLVQEDAFSEDIKGIRNQKGDNLKKHNKLQQLNAFLDDSGVLGVRG
ncbi:hypothetical protein QQF64_013390 [Cirrhinus molitorella]|uniref:Uncharacterized protein n=1 Tax=Cirrhinus molitorella TaxID=172907 RepID=A0ABR3LUJ6_9TELE